MEETRKRSVNGQVGEGRGKIYEGKGISVACETLGEEKEENGGRVKG